jgi:hypothetical protein
MQRHARLCWKALLAVGLLFVCINGTSSAGVFEDRQQFWADHAFFCKTGSLSFPSKEGEVSAADSAGCDDGDMTLFNGLLCAADVGAGCDGVRDAMDQEGRWWRSPRRIGWEAPSHDVSFSPDQSLGVLLYVLKKKDKARFKAWVSWIERKRPCLVQVGDSCLKQGWLRFCTDDQDDKRCTLRPGNCVTIERVAEVIGEDGQLCRRVMRELGLSEDILIPMEQSALSSALVNDKGFPLHLAGVQVLILKLLGSGSNMVQAASLALTEREPDNPFFAYLAKGKAIAVRDLALRLCPASDRPSKGRHQWAWERTDGDRAWERSMYWDCLFIGNLLGP